MYILSPRLVSLGVYHKRLSRLQNRSVAKRIVDAQGNQIFKKLVREWSKRDAYRFNFNTHPSIPNNISTFCIS